MEPPKKKFYQKKKFTSIQKPLLVKNVPPIQKPLLVKNTPIQKDLLVQTRNKRKDSIVTFRKHVAYLQKKTCLISVTQDKDEQKRLSDILKVCEQIKIFTKVASRLIYQQSNFNGKVQIKYPNFTNIH